MVRRFLLPMLMMSSLLTVGGCVSRAISEGLGKVTGPKGVTVVIEPVSNQKVDVSLEDYQHFEIGTFTDGFGGKIPSETNRLLPFYFSQQLREKHIINHASGKTLLVRGQFIHYENSSSVTNEVFGPFEELVARVELVDQSSGRVIGVANCIGRSTQTVNKGLDKKVQGLAEAIVSWIAQHYPKPAKK